jgi:hypothetical protein
MSITYHSLSGHPTTFQRLTGLTVREFNDVAKVVKPTYEEEGLKKVKDIIREE